MGPCAKQVVTATIITADGQRFVGRNDCHHPQLQCPRHDLPSGVGYHLCKQICAQPAHAEVMALARAGELARGAVLYLEGHTYACDDCRTVSKAFGIKVIIIGPPPPIPAFQNKKPHRIKPDGAFRRFFKQIGVRL